MAKRSKRASARKAPSARPAGARQTPTKATSARSGAIASRSSRPTTKPGAAPGDPLPAEIITYHQSLSISDRRICEALAAGIGRHLRGAERRVWHRHPVWFLDGNPIVGYSKLKDCVRLLFWSGQSFDEPGLAPEGTFKAGEARFTDAGQISASDLRRWLAKAREIQWDYKNIVKRKGRLERLA